MSFRLPVLQMTRGLPSRDTAYGSNTKTGDTKRYIIYMTNSTNTSNDLHILTPSMPCEDISMCRDGRWRTRCTTFCPARVTSSKSSARTPSVGLLTPSIIYWPKVKLLLPHLWVKASHSLPLSSLWSAPLLTFVIFLYLFWHDNYHQTRMWCRVGSPHQPKSTRSDLGHDDVASPNPLPQRPQPHCLTCAQTNNPRLLERFMVRPRQVRYSWRCAVGARASGRCCGGCASQQVQRTVEN